MQLVFVVNWFEIVHLRRKHSGPRFPWTHQSWNRWAASALGLLACLRLELSFFDRLVRLRRGYLNLLFLLRMKHGAAKFFPWGGLNSPETCFFIPHASGGRRIEHIAFWTSKMVLSPSTEIFSGSLSVFGDKFPTWASSQESPRWGVPACSIKDFHTHW